MTTRVPIIQFRIQFYVICPCHAAIDELTNNLMKIGNYWRLVADCFFSYTIYPYSMIVYPYSIIIYAYSMIIYSYSMIIYPYSMRSWRGSTFFGLNLQHIRINIFQLTSTQIRPGWPDRIEPSWPDFAGIHLSRHCSGPNRDGCSLLSLSGTTV